MSVAFNIIEYLLDEYLVGKEIRNLVFLMDDLFNKIQELADVDTVEIISGSSSEGMFNSGDVDIMTCQPDFIVVNKPSEIPADVNSGVLLLDPSECYPGFTNLILLKDIPNRTDDLYTAYNGKTYLNKDKYLNYVCERLFGRTDATLHGPAVLQEAGAADVVICLSCPTWPSCAVEFIERQRKYKVPSTKEIHAIRDTGCHIIAISHANSKRNDIEFRISFSAAEKYLIKRWNEKQIKCYYLCKELFSNHFKPEHDSEKGLCSYFAKSVIFWITEEKPSEFWMEYSTFDIQKEILKTIKIYLNEKSCKNYFIPKNLMMKTFTEEQTNALLQKLVGVEEDTIPYILTCDMFKRLSPNIELLCSIYQVVKRMGDDSKKESILQSVHDEMLISFDKRIALNGTYISCKRDLYQRITVSLLTKFMILVLRGNWAYQHDPIPTLLKLFSTFQEEYKSKYTSIELNMFKNCIERCLALHMLSLSCILDSQGESEVRDKTLASVEALLISSSIFPAYMNDLNTSSKVYLGMLYYLIDKQDAALKVLHESVLSAGILIADNFGSLIAMPIVIAGDGMNAPRFFRKKTNFTRIV